MKEIKRFVTENSYFELTNEEGDNFCEFSTRKHGSIFNEEYGPQDYTAAEELKAKLLKEFIDTKVEIDTFDEWVNICITLI